MSTAIAAVMTLELLTRQHAEIDALLARLAAEPARPDRVRELVELVAAHLAAEQEILYPAAAAVVSAGVMCELLLEHAAIKRAAADLLWLDGDDPHIEVRLAALAELLAGHAHWQEQELFGWVASTLDAAQLAELAAALHATTADEAVAA
jgi:hypothetical protein